MYVSKTQTKWRVIPAANLQAVVTKAPEPTAKAVQGKNKKSS